MLFFEHNPWLIIPGIILGAAYAFILYQKKNPWGRITTIILSSLRFLLAFLLYFLLLEPLIRQFVRHRDDPTVIMALDNSTSISSVLDSLTIQHLKQDFASLAENLRKNNFKVEFTDIGGKTYPDPGSVPIDMEQTDFSRLFNTIDNSYEGRNIAGLILISDGIYNAGSSPIYRNFKYPLVTVGIGDTLEKNDISVRAIYNNKVVYQGNRFTLSAEILNKGYGSGSTQIEIIHNKKVIQSKEIKFINSRGLQQVPFILEAEKPGPQRYIVRVTPLQNEQSVLNNSMEAFLEVIGAREKILLLAHAPHPDIKALKGVIERNQNYELTILTPDMGRFKPDKYNLVIYHQLPDSKGSFNGLIRENNLGSLPSIYILGAKTNLNAVTERLGWIRINALSSRSDNAFPVINHSFSGFIINEDEMEAIDNFPPLLVPFGEYSLGKLVDVALFQKVENVVTSRPLLAMARDGDKKMTVLTGEGLWRWRLNEYFLKNNHASFDSFLLKLIQFTCAREDRRKFRVYPVKNEFWDNEPVVFETEAYNVIFERVYGQEVTLSISSENGIKTGYSYSTSETSTRFRVTGLVPGVYNYSANTTLDGNEQSSNGIFTVRHQQAESINLTADFGLLRKMAEKSGGDFIKMNRMDSIPNLPVFQNAKPVIFSTENISALINLKWIFFILLAIITLEWGTRKYLGGY